MGQDAERIAAPKPRVLDLLSRGPALGEHYTLNTRSRGRWAGYVLIKELGISTGQARKTPASWAADGVLVPTSYRRRSTRNYYIASGLRVDASEVFDEPVASA
jgi:hypothetical protein